MEQIITTIGDKFMKPYKNTSKTIVKKVLNEFDENKNTDSAKVNPRHDKAIKLHEDRKLGIMSKDTYDKDGLK